jgi:hypothetical protein
MNGTRPDHEGGLRASSIRPWNEFGGRPAPWCAPRRSERTEPVFPGMVRRGKGDVHADSTVGGFRTAVPVRAARMRSARSTERMRQSAASRGGRVRPRNRPATWIATLWGIARERGGGVLITARHATTPDTTQGTRISLAGVRGPAWASTGSFPAEGEKSAAGRRRGWSGPPICRQPASAAIGGRCRCETRGSGHQAHAGWRPPTGGRRRRRRYNGRKLSGMAPFGCRRWVYRQDARPSRA